MATSEDFDSLDLDPDEFRELGYRTVDIIAEYFDGVEEVPVFPGKPQSEIEAAFEESLPDTGQDPETILEEWPDRVLPNATHLGSPRYFGFVNGSGTMVGVLAEALAASVNMNSGGWKPAPAATEIERRTITWIAEMIDYPTDCGGMFTSGGTMANLTGILTGLRATAAYDTKARGLQTSDRSGPFTIYMADHEGHSSIYRVAEVLGLGSDAVRLVPSHDDFTMDIDALEERLDRDTANGDTPFCVVAQVGSINVGAIDPLEEIAEVCEERDLWFHADGACGAFGAILPEKRPQYAGLDRADSVTLDPHKWLYIPYECGCILIRDASLLPEAFAMHAGYLNDSENPYEGLDYYEVSPKMSRGFRALKVWMSLKHYGVEGYRTLLSQNIHCAEHLDERVRDADDFVALHEPNLYLYSFQYAPPNLQEAAIESTIEDESIDEYLDVLNQRIAHEIQLSGVAFVKTTSIHDRTVLRLSICSHRTTPDDIDRTFETLREIGRREDEKLRQNFDVEA